MCRNIISGDGKSFYSNLKEASQKLSSANIYVYTEDKDALHLFLLKFTADFSITKAGYKRQLRSLWNLNALKTKQALWL